MRSGAGSGPVAQEPQDLVLPGAQPVHVGAQPAQITSHTCHSTPEPGDIGPELGDIRPEHGDIGPKLRDIRPELGDPTLHADQPNAVVLLRRGNSPHRRLQIAEQPVQVVEVIA